MPPRKSASASGSTSTARAGKTSSSISAAFRASGAKSSSTSSPFLSTSAVKPGSRSSSFTSSSLKAPGAAIALTPAANRSVSPEKKEERPLSKQEEEEAKELPELDVNDPSYNGIWKAVQKEKLGKVGAIHAEGQNRVHHILRTFDLDPAYGPCLGLTRLERWSRAKALGEEPPVEVLEILETREGRTKAEYRESCLAGTGI